MCLRTGGERVAKTNHPYTFLAHEKEALITDALAIAKTFYENGDKDKVFEILQKAYHEIPKPRENYEASVQIILAVMDYNNLYLSLIHI